MANQSIGDEVSRGDRQRRKPVAVGGTPNSIRVLSKDERDRVHEVNCMFGIHVLSTYSIPLQDRVVRVYSCLYCGCPVEVLGV